MDFTKVEVEDDLDDLEADELRDLLGEFSKAQDMNQDTYDEVTDTVAEFNEQNDKLVSEVVENSSLSETAAEALSYSDKRSLLDDLEGDDEEEQEFDEGGDEGGDGEQEFKDKGTKGNTHGDEGTPEFVEDAVQNINGIQ